MTDESVYDAAYYASHQTAGDRIALRYYARLIRAAQPRGGRLLDFGSGTGHLLRHLSRDFAVLGFDISPYAREQSRLHAPRATILEAWESIPPGSLDVVVALHTLEHLEHPGEVLAALVARLAAGGMLFAVVPNTEGLGHRLKKGAWFAHRDRTHRSLLPPGEWLRILADCDLRVAPPRGDGMWDAPYVRFVPRPLQRFVFGLPAAVQLLSPIARPFLPPALGECLILRAWRG